jgi:hypothetical protein
MECLVPSLSHRRSAVAPSRRPEDKRFLVASFAAMAAWLRCSAAPGSIALLNWTSQSSDEVAWPALMAS